jgi:hypothetical protein
MSRGANCWVPLQSDTAALVAASEFPQASVRQRAARVLLLLGGDTTAAPPLATSVPRGASSSAPDLLGGLMDDAETLKPPENANDFLGTPSGPFQYEVQTKPRV